MTRTIEAAISEAKWKATNRRTVQLIVRFRSETACRYISVRSLNGVIKRTRAGESPLLILRVFPDGTVLSACKEFDGARY